MSSKSDEPYWISCNSTELPSWWFDWKEQQRRSIRTFSDLKRCFQNISLMQGTIIEEVTKSRKLQLTPYLVRLIALTSGATTDDLSKNPLWRQFVPLASVDRTKNQAYDGETDNWESPEEMVTPIAQKKYDNRIIVRVTNSCFAYCQFCYHALRTLDLQSRKSSQSKDWDDTLWYIEKNHDIEEIILSGGEPLLLSDEKLDLLLSHIRNVRPDIVIRIHSRVLTFNPFRVNEELVAILHRYNVVSIGVHIAGPIEMTSEFRYAAKLLRQADILLVSNTPLLAGVNDDANILHALFHNLYKERIVPYYLYHFMPFSPGIESLACPIEKGVELMRMLDKRFTGITLPSYVLPHHSGKYTVPTQHGAYLNFAQNTKGDRVLKFINWMGQECEYVDIGYKPSEDTEKLPSPALPLEAYTAKPIESFEGFQRRTGKTDLINAGNNEAMHEVHPAIARTIQSYHLNVSAYPDSESFELVQQIARKFQVSEDSIIIGSGSDELLSLSLRIFLGQGDSIVTTKGTYPTLFYFLKGLNIVSHTVDYESYSVPYKSLVELAHRHNPKLVYIANPDNPTGSFLIQSQIDYVASNLPSGCILLLDEAYSDFVSEETLIKISETPQNVVRVRSFSKLHGLAGLRVGYLIASPSITSFFRGVRLHFGVNTLAQACATIALKNHLYYENIRNEINTYRNHLKHILEKHSLSTVVSHTNFVLVLLNDAAESQMLQSLLLDASIFVRRPSELSLQNTLRISLPPIGQWDTFVAKLEQVLSEFSSRILCNRSVNAN